VVLLWLASFQVQTQPAPFVLRSGFRLLRNALEAGTDTSPVDIGALAARYENPDFWRQSMQEEDDPEQ